MQNEDSTPKVEITIIRFQRHGNPEVESAVIRGTVNYAIFDNFAWSKVIQSR